MYKTLTTAATIIVLGLTATGATHAAPATLHGHSAAQPGCTGRMPANVPHPKDAPPPHPGP
jgi:hypothetical protein